MVKGRYGSWVVGDAGIIPGGKKDGELPEQAERNREELGWRGRWRVPCPRVRAATVSVRPSPSIAPRAIFSPLLGAHCVPVTCDSRKEKKINFFSSKEPCAPLGLLDYATRSSRRRSRVSIDCANGMGNPGATGDVISRPTWDYGGKCLVDTASIHAFFFKQHSQ